MCQDRRRIPVGIEASPGSETSLITIASAPLRASFARPLSIAVAESVSAAKATTSVPAARFSAISARNVRRRLQLNRQRTAPAQLVRRHFHRPEVRDRRSSDHGGRSREVFQNRGPHLGCRRDLHKLAPCGHPQRRRGRDQGSPSPCAPPPPRRAHIPSSRWTGCPENVPDRWPPESLLQSPEWSRPSDPHRRPSTLSAASTSSEVSASRPLPVIPQAR